MKQFSFLKLALSSASLALVLLINGCAPIFSEMQDARTVGKNNVDATASYSSVSFRDTEEKSTFKIQNHVGIQASYGVSDRVDVRLRYAYVWVSNDADAQVSVIGIGPKFSFIKDRLSGYLPLGFAFGSDVENSSKTWQIHPTIIGTFPINDKFDINPSFKVLIPFESEIETTLAVNIGLGVKLIENFIIRPEFGVLVNPGEEGYFSQFSLGLTYAPSGYADRD